MDFKDEIKKLNQRGPYNTPRRVRNLMARCLARAETLAVPEEKRLALILQGSNWLLQGMKADAAEKRLAKLEKSVERLLAARETNELPWAATPLETPSPKTSHKGS